MFKTTLLLAAVAALSIAHQESHQENCDGEVITHAIVRLEGNGITGNITFTRVEDRKIHVSGHIEGMEKGKYGFHVHQSGDITNGCHSTKGHFNPDNHDHGHPHEGTQHAGDFPNVEFNEHKLAVVDFVDHKIALSGRYSVIGRALVLNEKEDDYGQTEHPDSKKTGNTGAHVACGVIGIL